MIILSFLGLIIGIISSLLGIGGGAIIVPSFQYLYPTMPITQIITHSLFYIFLACTYTSLRFLKLKAARMEFESKTCAILCVGIVVGSSLGKSLLPYIDPQIIKKLFGYSLLVFALLSILKYFQLKKSTATGNQVRLIALRYHLLLGVVSGFISALTGLGGGIILIPVFTMIYRWSPLRSSFYSNLCISFAGFVGIIRYYLSQSSPSDELQYSIMFILFCGTLFGVPLGINLAQKLSQKFSIILQCLVFLIIGIKTLI